MSLAPPPTNDPPGSFSWNEWYKNLRNYVAGASSIPWSTVNKTGSSLADLVTRNHSNLNNVLGSGAYHLSQTEQQAIGNGLTTTVTLAKLTTGGTTGSLTFTNGILTAKTDPT